MNQLSLSKITKWVWHLTLVLLLLAPLMSANLAHAAGRVFYDGFESGNTNQWGADDYRDKCTVVSSSTDGVAGPYAGTKMTRCNWNGSVAWNDPAAFETLTIDTVDYTNELFMRTRLRLDVNMNAGTKLLRFYRADPELDFFGSTGDGNCTSLKNEGAIVGNNLTTYWGGASGDNTCVTSGWHKVEYYFKQSTGTIKAWHDGILVRNDTGLNFQGEKWSPFFIGSNAHLPFDSTNYVYFDEFEIYSDTGSGSTGSMSDATISNGAGTQTVPNPLTDLEVTVTP